MWREGKRRKTNPFPISQTCKYCPLCVKEVLNWLGMKWTLDRKAASLLDSVLPWRSAIVVSFPVGEFSLSKPGLYFIEQPRLKGTLKDHLIHPFMGKRARMRLSSIPNSSILKTSSDGGTISLRKSFWWLIVLTIKKFGDLWAVAGPEKWFGFLILLPFGWLWTIYFTSASYCLLLYKLVINHTTWQGRFNKLQAL